MFCVLVTTHVSTASYYLFACVMYRCYSPAAMFKLCTCLSLRSLILFVYSGEALLLKSVLSFNKADLCMRNNDPGHITEVLTHDLSKFTKAKM